jgi:hypothetical protein
MIQSNKMISEMSDLEIAKRMLIEEGFSLVIVKSKIVIHAAREYGVIGLMQAIETHGAELAGSAVADKVVGKAAAMLCRYAKIAEVYADVISKKGLNTLREKEIRVEYRELVPEILNRRRNDACPFEKLVSSCIDEKECYEKIKSFKNQFSKLF